MKINEVCKRTGLTERAVRFYVEKGLLQTKSQLVNGRINRDFSEEDLDILLDISKLRKAGFSIQDILDMQNAPENIGEIVERHYYKIEEEYKLREVLLDDLSEARKRGEISWRKLASLLLRKKKENTPETICYPLDDVEFKEPPKRVLSHSLKHTLKWGALILLIVFVIGIFIYSKHHPATVSSTFVISEVMVDDKWYDDGGQKYISIYSTCPHPGYEDYFEYPRTIKVESEDYFNAIQTESKPYTSFNIWIEIPHDEAEENGLLDAQGNIITEKVLGDTTYIKKYCTVRILDYK